MEHNTAFLMAWQYLGVVKKRASFFLFSFAAPYAASRQHPIFSGCCLEAAPARMRK
ncbi:MAG: hypothetical protein N2A40_04015 [Desulfobulbaceae bacterium]